MPIPIVPTDVRYAIASLSNFVDHWLHQLSSNDAIALRELHAARVVLSKARMAIDEHDAPLPGYELDAPAWFPAASLSHRMHVRAEARNESEMSSPRTMRRPHP